MTGGKPFGLISIFGSVANMICDSDRAARRAEPFIDNTPGTQATPSRSQLGVLPSYIPGMGLAGMWTRSARARSGTQETG